MIYLNCNDMVLMSENVKNEIIKWISNKNDILINDDKSQNMINKFRNCIMEYLRISDINDEDGYHIIFNSGASEGNNFILYSIVNAYKRSMLNELQDIPKDEFTNGSMTKPHIIISDYEHKSIIGCCSLLVQAGEIEVSMVHADHNGCIKVSDIEQKIKDNTCLISIMAANSELGTLNNIHNIGKFAHSIPIPFHTDASQIFGRFDEIKMDYVDILTSSFSKIGGPPGSGVIIIKNALLEGYSLAPQIYETDQCSNSYNYGYRGGNLNIPNLAGSFISLKESLHNRIEKNEKIIGLRNDLIKYIEKTNNLVFWFNNLCKKEEYLKLFLQILLTDMKGKTIKFNGKLIKIGNKIIIIYGDKEKYHKNDTLSFSIISIEENEQTDNSEYINLLKENGIIISSNENRTSTIEYVLKSIFRNLASVAAPIISNNLSKSKKVLDNLLNNLVNGFIRLSFNEKNNKNDLIKTINLILK